MIAINEKLCKGCGICIEFCPRNVFEMSKEINEKGVHVPLPKSPERCTKCNICVLMCPDQAISVNKNE
ncbi:2-oxoglutarate ferredoxin oxidoreductase, delta subunit [Methanothermus fervidus DSM 2088]|uniref:2-oxoglutarate ferredoxin oxidoreductase, delta subunit n=1 Tax=Methanothermus fervidus (strain ATCC 43054 / DSM 2088 / JCM 10308 / V24 S) TaxID=523846 RepID=E3GWM6_METFV|nr:ferredoxin family protein [Methanothermus fervidus]ADP76840.1 2-oxoglutarate ferredoxin oxidoreductase, delta subunit [Methanothermus fervidus DSM 2088]